MTTRVLNINASIFGDQGVSSQLSHTLIEQLRARHRNLDLQVRDLSQTEIPHFDARTIAAIGEGKAALADQLIAEVQAADILVLGVPMYNFGVPSQLKAWFDHIARARVTFKYTENGPVGLLTGKKVYVITTRGGIYKDQASDSEVPFLKTMLGFIGLSDVDFIYAEGLNMGDDRRKQAIDQANQQIHHLFHSETTLEEELTP